MTRRGRHLSFLILLAILVPSASAGQELRGYLTGGASIPSDPPEFTELWSPAWSVGVGLGVRVAPRFEVGASANFQFFPTDEAAQVDGLLLTNGDVTVEITGVEGREVRVFTLMGDFRYHFSDPGARVSPFLTLGTGLYAISMSDAQVTPDPRSGIEPVNVLGETDTSFGVTVGGGLDFRVGRRTGLLAEVIHTVGFTQKTAAQSLGVRLGLAVGWGGEA